MFDAYGRNIHYLRLSVTDLCNLRCRYCMPDGVPKLAHEDILTYEEFLRLAALFAQCSIDTVRITGGEPLVRRGVEQLTAFPASAALPLPPTACCWPRSCPPCWRRALTA